jgi:hypothetical protein
MIDTEQETSNAQYQERLLQWAAEPANQDRAEWPRATPEAIALLSAPPYYTACPNPWLADYVSAQATAPLGAPAVPREPYTAPTLEGKNHAVYRAHSYHTKVPHRAIMHHILHYTEPGAVVYDCYAGTGMTGVAAQLCGDAAEVVALGYRVTDTGEIYKEVTLDNGTVEWVQFSRLGARKAVLTDLSPVASHISYHYNLPAPLAEYREHVLRLLDRLEHQYGWLYDTVHSDHRTQGRILHTDWSEVYLCPHCQQEFSYWSAVQAAETGAELREFPCPHCAAPCKKTCLERVWVTEYDPVLQQEVRRTKRVPVRLTYTVGKQRYTKTPDAADLQRLQDCNTLDYTLVPTPELLPPGEKFSCARLRGHSHLHQYYTARNYLVLAAYVALCKEHYPAGLWLATAIALGVSQMARYSPYKTGGTGKFPNTLYLGALQRENNVLQYLRRQLRLYPAHLTAVPAAAIPPVLVNTGSSTTFPVPEGSIDYVFCDPPFGANIQYTELNSVWEHWLGVRTNPALETVESKTQQKSLVQYGALLTDTLQATARALRPGGWCTLIFSSVHADVWNTLLTAVGAVGLQCRAVAPLHKQQGSHAAHHTQVAVRQDLALALHKPLDGCVEWQLTEPTEQHSVAAVTQQRLLTLPADAVERDPRYLYDHLLRYYVLQGCRIPCDSKEYQTYLQQHYVCDNGLYRLSTQTAT